MNKKTYHKFEIKDRIERIDSVTFGIDPIDVDGALGMPDNMYELLCKHSTCVVCNKKVRDFGQHRACFREEKDETIIPSSGRVRIEHHCALEFFIPMETYIEHFSPVIDHYLRHRSHSRRADRLAKNGGSHTHKETRQLFKCQSGRCYYCFKFIDEDGEGGIKGHLDHMRSLTNGGTDNIENMVFACPPCNFDKGAGDFESFIEKRVRWLSASQLKALHDMHRCVEDWKNKIRASKQRGRMN